jgi:hypothetical protein
MKINKLFVCAVALTAWGMVGCGGVEGTYKLDKAETKKAMQADIAKMPADDQKFAQLGLAMVDAMDVTMELKSGGAASMKMTMPNLMDSKGPAKTDEETGTWKKDGDNVIITDSKDKKETKCEKSGKKLTCHEPSAGGKDNTMVFVKS